MNGKGDAMQFPIDTSAYKPLELDWNSELTPEQKSQLETNISVFRDVIIFFTAIAGAKGLAGHTGGPYNIVPEVLISRGFMRGQNVHPVCFDEAGHRVAIQYALAAFDGDIEFERLLHYREAEWGLYGHPELDPELGIHFSSGRLGHMFPFVNGIARAGGSQRVVLFGSDGSQQEGNDAEAARHAVAHQLPVKVVVDDNNVTIAGHPSDYLPGFDLARTFEGYGFEVAAGQGEDIDDLYARMRQAFAAEGPVAVINSRVMAAGVPDIEGSYEAHDVVPKDAAIKYLKNRGHDDAVSFLEAVEPEKSGRVYRGSSEEVSSNRKSFGNLVCELIADMDETERKQRVLAIDSDLEGSTGLKPIGQRFPEVYVKGGVMERGNFSAAAGFGFENGRQGIFSTFAAFQEMVISEISMARLNDSNVLCHFSHSGVDDIADNTCHYGINLFYADSSPAEVSATTRLYFAADTAQFSALVRRVFSEEGMRFVYSTRSKVPFILKENGERFYDENYEFVPDRDEVIREGTDGYVISYGEMLYRALDAVEQLREEGMNVGLINKPTLNTVDEDTIRTVGKTAFALVVETQNRQNGLGIRYGSWLLQRGMSPRYDHLGVTKRGSGGLGEHIVHQGLDSESIAKAAKALRA